MPHETWKAGPRVRVDTLRKGDRFIAADGIVYEYVRVDGALSGVHHVTGPGEEKTSFAGCAQGVRVDTQPTQPTETPEERITRIHNEAMARS